MADSGQGQSQKVWSSDRREFSEDEFMDGDVTVTGNGFEQVGEYKVGADQRIEFGQGDRSLEAQEQGRPNIDLKDTGGDDVQGTVRFLHVSAQEGRVHKIRDISQRSLRQSTRSERITFVRASKPSQPGAGKPAAGRDDFLRIKVNISNYSDLTNGVIGIDESTITQPVTVWERN